MGHPDFQTRQRGLRRVIGLHRDVKLCVICRTVEVNSVIPGHRKCLFLTNWPQRICLVCFSYSIKWLICVCQAAGPEVGQRGRLWNQRQRDASGDQQRSTNPGSGSRSHWARHRETLPERSTGWVCLQAWKRLEQSLNFWEVLNGSD